MRRRRRRRREKGGSVWCGMESMVFGFGEWFLVDRGERGVGWNED